MKIENQHVPWWQQIAKLHITSSWNRTARHMDAYDRFPSGLAIYRHP
jgi:hypothetical protein